MLWLGVGPPWLQLVLRLPPTAPISLEPTLGSTVLWPLLPPEPCLILGGPRLPLLPEPWLTLGGTRASVTLWAVSDSGGMRASVTPWAVPDSREACAGQAQFPSPSKLQNRTEEHFTCRWHGASLTQAASLFVPHLMRDTCCHCQELMGFSFASKTKYKTGNN